MRQYASLRGRREFALVMRRGRPSSGKHLIVFSLPPTRMRPARARSGVRQRANGVTTKVGIVITKKVGDAVARNKLRRRCKAILDAMSIGQPPHWYVIQFRPSAASLSFAQLREGLQTALCGPRSVGQGVPRVEELRR